VPRGQSDGSLRPNSRISAFVQLANRNWDIKTAKKLSPYLTGNTLRLSYRAQPVNAVWGNSWHLL
jgi:hypothetical protein